MSRKTFVPSIQETGGVALAFAPTFAGYVIVDHTPRKPTPPKLTDEQKAAIVPITELPLEEAADRIIDEREAAAAREYKAWNVQAANWHKLNELKPGKNLLTDEELRTALSQLSDRWADRGDEYKECHVVRTVYQSSLWSDIHDAGDSESPYLYGNEYPLQRMVEEYGV